MQELITIGIPTYNVAKYLRESLDSVINQTYMHLDILVIDDGSVDDSVAISLQTKKKAIFDSACLESFIFFLNRRGR